MKTPPPAVTQVEKGGSLMRSCGSHIMAAYFNLTYRVGGILSGKREETTRLVRDNAGSGRGR